MSNRQDQPEFSPELWSPLAEKDSPEEEVILSEDKKSSPSAVEAPLPDNVNVKETTLKETTVEEVAVENVTVEETPAHENQEEPNLPEPNLTVKVKKEVKREPATLRRSRRIASLKEKKEDANKTGGLREEKKPRTTKRKAKGKAPATSSTTAASSANVTTKRKNAKGKAPATPSALSSKSTKATSTAATSKKRKLDEDYDQTEEITDENNQGPSVKSNKKKAIEKKDVKPSVSKARTSSTTKPTKKTERRASTSTTGPNKRSTRSGRNY